MLWNFILFLKATSFEWNKKGKQSFLSQIVAKIIYHATKRAKEKCPEKMFPNFETAKIHSTFHTTVILLILSSLKFTFFNLYCILKFPFRCKLSWNNRGGASQKLNIVLFLTFFSIWKKMIYKTKPICIRYSWYKDWYDHGPSFYALPSCLNLLSSRIVHSHHCKWLQLYHVKKYIEFCWSDPII